MKNLIKFWLWVCICIFGYMMIYGITNRAHAVNCNCYYAYSDCPEKFFCATIGIKDGKACSNLLIDECICKWRKPKPGKEGEGEKACDKDADTASPNCDGLCIRTPPCSKEDSDQMRKAIELWADAVTEPAIAGGGLIDQTLAEQVLSLPFNSQYFAEQVGREILGLMEVTRGTNFIIHPNVEHIAKDHSVVDISSDSCRIASGNLAVDALLAEIQVPGTGGAVIDQIPSSCPGTLPFSERCSTDPDPLGCLKEITVGIAPLFRSCPTVIQLISLIVIAGDDQVLLEWTTGAEIDNEGFNILRSDVEDSPYIQINDVMIPAMAISPGGARYDFVDATVENGNTYFYQLKDIDTRGVSTLHGPIEITVIEGETSSLDISNETQSSAVVGDGEEGFFDSSSDSDSFFGCGFIRPTGNTKPPGAGQVAVTLLIVFSPLLIILARRLMRMRGRRLLTNGQLPIAGGSGEGANTT